MARPRPAKKSEPAPPAERRVLPMELRVGDRLVEATGEWEIVATPYTANAGKNVHVRVRRVGQPGVTAVRSWSAHERIAVKRG